MTFIGIDLHTNRFTCCYRDGRLSDCPEDRVTKTFELDESGLAAFSATLTEDTYVLAAAEPFMAEIGILTSMKGVSVFIADIIEASRFKDSKVPGFFMPCHLPLPRQSLSIVHLTCCR
jgi:hypothetical protein